MVEKLLEYFQNIELVKDLNVKELPEAKIIFPATYDGMEYNVYQSIDAREKEISTSKKTNYERLSLAYIGDYEDKINLVKLIPEDNKQATPRLLSLASDEYYYLNEGNKWVKYLYVDGSNKIFTNLEKLKKKCI